MKLVVGNQKTYMNIEDVVNFIENTKNEKCENAVICPSYIYIDYYVDHSKYVIGSQNVSPKDNGASTGEISAEQLNSLGVTFSIVAHSERRKDYLETSEMFINKIK